MGAPMAESIGLNTNQGGKDSCESSDRRDLEDRLHKLLEDAPFKWECIAHEIGVDVSLLSHWTSGRGPMPAYRLIKITETIGPGLLRWIAQRCGYDLIRNEEAAQDRPRTA